MDWDNYWQNVYADWVTPIRLGVMDDWCTHTKSDVDFLESVWGRNSDQRILDVSCGWGRHAIELKTRGYNVVGLDFSLPLLQLAKNTSSTMNVKLPLILMDRRQIWWEEEFNAVLQLYDAPWLGYWETYEQHLDYLQRIYCALKPGGYFITGATDYSMNMEDAVRKEKKFMDAENSPLLDNLISSEQYNHYTYKKIHDLLETSLFVIEKESNDYIPQAPYDPGREGLVIVSRAPKTTVEIWVYTRNPVIEVLMLRRKRQSGWGKVFWQPITGTIDLDETPEEAARRELEEESGITSWKQFTDLKTPFSFPTRGLGTLHKTLYAVEVLKQPVTLDAREHDAFRWVPMEQIREMLFWESNIQGLEVFREFLNQ